MNALWNRLAFWRKPVMVPAPSGECRHLWGNWSAPAECELKVTTFGYGGMPAESTERPGMSQDRSCLQCNIYERRLA